MEDAEVICCTSAINKRDASSRFIEANSYRDHPPTIWARGKLGFLTLSPPSLRLEYQAAVDAHYVPFTLDNGNLLMYVTVTVLISERIILMPQIRKFAYEYDCLLLSWKTIRWHIVTSFTNKLLFYVLVEAGWA